MSFLDLWFKVDRSMICFLVYGEKRLKIKGCCYFYYEMDNYVFLLNLGAKCYEFDI